LRALINFFLQSFQNVHHCASRTSRYFWQQCW